jgi:DNA-binding NtrC family response regulator
VISRGPVISLDHLSLGDVERPGTVTSRPEPERLSLGDVEREHVRRILQQTGGNKRQAARILEISRPRLDRLIAKYGLGAAEPE